MTSLDYLLRGTGQHLVSPLPTGWHTYNMRTWDMNEKWEQIHQPPTTHHHIYWMLFITHRSWLTDTYWHLQYSRRSQDVCVIFQPFLCMIIIRMQQGGMLRRSSARVRVRAQLPVFALLILCQSICTVAFQFTAFLPKSCVINTQSLHLHLHHRVHQHTWYINDEMSRKWEQYTNWMLLLVHIEADWLSPTDTYSS